MAKHARLGAAVALTLALAGTQAGAGEAEKVLATVNGTAITLGHVATMLEQLPAEYQALPDEVLYKGILEQLIQQTVLAQSVEGRTTARDDIAIENERRAYLATVAMRTAIDGAVTDDAIATLYKERYADAAPQTEYNAAHILVETEEEATKLKADLDGGSPPRRAGALNPTWVEWLMGFPLGWTALPPSATPSSRRPRSGSGGASSNTRRRRTRG